MMTCPECGSRRVFRSKTRNPLERFRRQFTIKRPYRCHNCDWRGWAAEGSFAASPEDLSDAAAPPPDLDAIDAALNSTRK